MSRLTWALAALVAAACLTAFAPEAAAQVYVPPPINYGPGIQSIRNSQMLTLRQMVERNAIRKGQSGSRGKSSPGRPSAGGNNRGGTPPGRGAPAPSAGGTTTFRPVAPMIAPQQLAAKVPAERKELEKFYAGLLEDYRRILRGKGVPENDVARAASFAVVVSHDVYNERDLTQAQTEGLRRQMREIFAEDAEFQRMPDRARQELYESYAIIGMLISSLYDGSVRGNHQKGIEQMRSLARTQLEETFGVPVERLAFTDDGVKYR